MESVLRQGHESRKLIRAWDFSKASIGRQICLLLAAVARLSASRGSGGRSAQHNRIHLTRDESPIIQVCQQLAVLHDHLAA
jgi:hypothetical protein